MQELFRLKIAAKRQITIPQRLLDLLHLSEGDEIRITTLNGQIAATEPCKVVPTSLFTPGVLSQLADREAQIAKGKFVVVNPEKLRRTAKHKGILPHDFAVDGGPEPEAVGHAGDRNAFKARS